MAWFWNKKKPAAAADANGAAHVTEAEQGAQAQQAVDAAVATARRSDKEWRRQAAQLRQEEKQREKQRARAAKQQLAEMKHQARAARKQRARAEKLAAKQAKAVLKVHRREQTAERKRVKAVAKLRHAAEKRRKRLMRKRQKEERRRRKQARKQDARARHQEPDVHAVEQDEALMPADEAAAPVHLQGPKFKEDTRCKSCHLQFQRLPTRRRHHCRNCGESFCSKCLSGVKRPIPWFKLDKPQKVCFSCDVQVFNGMGGATRPGRSESSTGASPLRSTTATSSPVPVATPVEAAGVPPEQRSRSPLRAQRSASFQSEQPEDSPRAASPPSSRSGLSFRLRPRSRRDGSSSKSKKASLWTLPIRPLLKRKASADQLRNRSWDFDLRIEKEAMLARQRQSQMVAVPGAPQFATAS